MTSLSLLSIAFLMASLAVVVALLKDCGLGRRRVRQLFSSRHRTVMLGAFLVFLAVIWLGGPSIVRWVIAHHGVFQA